ncbi:MAG: hypothetical protein M0036_18000 [Desulfobacteraceae bacterium]|nr:hypothetical protein [Desulfobacteraceae bacterium]
MHPNIFIFDFWAIVAEDNPTPAQGQVNCLRYEYEGSHTDNDSHPNAAANEIAGPIFAQTIVDAIQIFTSGGGQTNGGTSSSSSSSGGESTSSSSSSSGGASTGDAAGGSGGCFIWSLFQ